MNFSQIFLGPFTLKFYGVFVAMAFLVTAILYYQRLKLRDLDREFFVHHFWRWIMGGVVLGRVFALISDPSILGRNDWLSFFAFWDGGISMLAVLVGFLAVMRIDIYRAKQDFLPWTDAMVFPVMVGAMILDIGSFITGAVYGSPTEMPWGVKYETFGVDLLSPLHPVTLYGFVLHFWLFRWVERRFEPFLKHPGKLTYSAMFFFFGMQFVLEFFRGDPSFMNLPIRLLQVFSLVISVTALVVLQRYRKK